MSGAKPKRGTANSAVVRAEMGESFRAISRLALHLADRGLPRVTFQREILKAILASSGCDAVETRLTDGELRFRSEAIRGEGPAFIFEIIPGSILPDGRYIPCQGDDGGLESLCFEIFRGRLDSSHPFVTPSGSVWMGDVVKPISLAIINDDSSEGRTLHIGGPYRSLALVPFIVDEKNVGVLILKSRQGFYFTQNEIEFYEGFAQTCGIAVAHRRARAALTERVKELSCLYNIADLAGHPGIALPDVFRDVISLLPPAMRYSDIAFARIVVDHHTYSTPGFPESAPKLTSPIIVGLTARGIVQVAYSQEQPDVEIELFLQEEQNLIDAVARQLALVVERRQAEDDRGHMLEQVRHADRLATIGQLAAGVAHELNEPLGNILGFAQLAAKAGKLPEQTGTDLQRIVDASMHAREVIRKLLLFARQMPPQKVPVNINRVIEDGLFFLESRCAKQGITLIRDLAPRLPAIIADASQLNQVLVNLVVNAIQAMPDGGTLTVRTAFDDRTSTLIVEDTGAGMTEDVLERVFIPFFTTKDVGEGTGLGLPVVHGIVTAHGGCIEVDSHPGSGTRFTVRLPAAAPGKSTEDPHCGIDT